MSEHALFSPSGAYKWMNCPGSIPLERGIPNISSDYADEGTDAHELAAMALTSEAKQTFAFTGRKLGKGFEATEEMCDYVQRYVDAVLQYAGDDFLLVEQKVNFSKALNVPEKEAFGTADAIVFGDDELQLHDLKYGKGVRVDATNNKQLMMYALGALPLANIIGRISRVRLVIHQPRLEHLSEWDCSVEELAAFAEEAKAAAARVVSGDSTLNPGPEQCRWCRAKGTCPALAGEVAAIAGVAFDSPYQKQLVTPKYNLNQYMAKVDIIEDWCSAVRKAVYDTLAAGGEVPGYKLVEGRRGARAWRDENDVELELKAMRMRSTEMYTQKLASPTQIEKVLKNRPKSWQRMQAFITQSEGRPSVAPLSDKRPAIAAAQVAQPDEFDILEDDPPCQTGKP